MRTATIVLVAYLCCVVVAALWRLVPWIADAIPDLGALTAAYLGLTARRQVSPRRRRSTGTPPARSSPSS